MDVFGLCALSLEPQRTTGSPSPPPGGAGQCRFRCPVVMSVVILVARRFRVTQDLDDSLLAAPLHAPAPPWAVYPVTSTGSGFGGDVSLSEPAQDAAIAKNPQEGRSGTLKGNAPRVVVRSGLEANRHVVAVGEGPLQHIPQCPPEDLRDGRRCPPSNRRAPTRLCMPHWLNGDCE